jgi:hypothetical protein
VARAKISCSWTRIDCLSEEYSTICYSGGWRWRGRGGITASSGSKCEDEYARDRRFTALAPSPTTILALDQALHVYNAVGFSHRRTQQRQYSYYILRQRLELVRHLGQNEGEKALMQHNNHSYSSLRCPQSHLPQRRRRPCPWQQRYEIEYPEFDSNNNKSNNNSISSNYNRRID